jgi:short-subunit dehydrogenase
MIAMITGAAGGLGRAMAVECARRGYDVYLTDISQAALTELAGGLRRQFDVNAYCRACDLTSDADVKAMFADMDAEGVQPNMLLNIAGVDYEGGFLTRTSEEILHIVRLNIEATLRVTHAALQRRAQGRFHIVTVSSLASLYPIPLKATYAASKRFLLDFSIALGQELRKEDVRVLALCPGGLPTTQAALRGIAAQGFWGNVTTNQLGLVARHTISRALAGRRTYIPGFVNRTLSFLGKLVPDAWIASLLYMRWNAAQKKWLHPAGGPNCA